MARYASDDALLERCRAGDAAAWDALVARYRRLVWSVIVQHRLRDEDAEDAFQQVFAALVANIDSVRDEAGLASWLGTTARRLCWRNSARTRRNDAVRSLDAPVGSSDSDAPRLDPADPNDTVAQVALGRDRLLVREGLERLGGKCRDLLEALFGATGEPNYALISERLGIRVGSIGPTRARCLEKLAVVLGRLGFGSDTPARPGAEEPDDAP